MFDTMMEYNQSNDVGCFMLGMLIINKCCGLTVEEATAAFNSLINIGTGYYA